MPTVSILLLCWNHRDFIAQCVDSLREQTSRDFEVVFLDNHSTDGSFELAAKLLGELKVPVTLIQNDQPQRITLNNNRLLAASSGSLLCLLSTDDWYAPAYVEAMIAGARQHLEAGMFYPNGVLYFEDERRFEALDPSGHRSGDVLEPLMRGEAPIFHVGCCYRRGVVEQLGGWDESLQIEDLDFLLRLAAAAPVHKVEEALVYYRRSGSSVSLDLDFMVAGWEQFYAKHRAAGFYDMELWMAEQYRRYAAIALDRGERRTAAHLLLKSLKKKPLLARTYRTLAYLCRKMLLQA